MMEIKEFSSLASRLRIDCLNRIHRAGEGNVVGCFSCIDLLIFLYFWKTDSQPIMNFDIKKTHSDARDYLVLSEWDCAPALYTVLAEAGFFAAPDSLPNYPVRKVPGVEAELHSFGHGLSYGNGIALALKQDKKPNRVYVVMGDEEMQIGTMWEAALTTAHHKLDNITLIINNNRAQHTGFTRGIKALDSIGQTFASLGWNVAHVLNGHDPLQLEDGIKRAWKIRTRPTVLVCDTVLGKGVPFAENKPSYHGVPFSNEEMKAALAFLNKAVIL